MALPPSPQLDSWNENDAKLNGTLLGALSWLIQRLNREEWNCYNYGVNKKTYDANGAGVRAHPGKGKKWPKIGKNITRQQMCDKVKARAKQDNLTNIAWNEGDPIPTPPEGQNLVALGALAGLKGDGGDYHWWRLNGDGSWSHKRGSDKAKTTYTDGLGQEQPLTDPREAAQRDGYSLCGFMGVPKDPPPNIGELALATGCGPGEGRTVVTQVVSSGYSDQEMHLSQQQVAELQPFLPTFTSSNQVPDPNWSGVPAGASAGFVIFFDSSNPQPPVPLYLRVFQAVAEVLHYRQDLNAWNKFFYNDDNGLEQHLQDSFKPPEGACCDLDGFCEITSPCTCQTLGGTYHGDGVSCQDKAAVCTAQCPWDLDGDGAVGIDDFLVLLALWGTDPGGPPDFDGDGTVGISDFLALLAYWGPCPQ